MVSYSPLRHVIGLSQNGEQVYGYLAHGSLATIIGRSPRLLTLIKEIISNQSLSRPAENIERNMGRSIGYSEVIETKPDDDIFYAQQSKGEHYTRFVKHRKAESTTILSFGLTRDQDGNYELHRVTFGREPAPTPNPSSPDQAHVTFWEHHAIVYSGQLIRSSTVQKTWPY